MLKESMVFGPDFVAVGFCMNDVVEPFVVDRNLGGTGLDYHEITQVPGAFFGYLLNETGFGRLVQQRRLKSTSLDAEVRKEVYNVTYMASHLHDDPRMEEAWRMTLADLDAIYAFAKNNDTEVVLLIFPYVLQFLNDQLKTPQQRLVEHGREQGVDVIDFTPVFEKAVFGRIADIDLFQHNRFADSRNHINNLLANSDFELWSVDPNGAADGWELYDGAAGSRSEQPFHGTFAQEMTAAGQHQGIRQTGICVKPNTEYVWIVRAKSSEEGGLVSLRMTVFDETHDSFVVWPDFELTTRYEQYICRFTTASETESVWLGLNSGDQKGKVCLDDTVCFEANADNLLVNGNFDFWSAGQTAAADGWEFYDGATGCRAESLSSGISAQRVVSPGKHQGIRQAGIDVKPGTGYTLIVRAKKSDSEGLPALRISVFDDTNMSFVIWPDFDLTTSYQQFFCTFTTAPNTETVWVGLNSGEAEGTFYVDGTMLLEGAAVPERFFLDRSHFTVEGHRIVAVHLLDYLRQKNLIHLK